MEKQKMKMKNKKNKKMRVLQNSHQMITKAKVIKN